MVLPDPAAVAGLIGLIGGSITNLDDDEANTNTIRYKAYTRDRGKPYIPVYIYLPFTYTISLIRIDTENNNRRSFRSITYYLVN